MADGTLQRSAFRELAEGLARKLEAAPPPLLVADEILQVSLPCDGASIELLHEFTSDSFLMRAALTDGPSVPTEDLLNRALHANWAFACLHMPLIALDSRGNGLVYTVEQMLDGASVSDMATTARHLASLRAQVHQLDSLPQEA